MRVCHKKELENLVGKKVAVRDVSHSDEWVGELAYEGGMFRVQDKDILKERESTGDDKIISKVMFFADTVLDVNATKHDMYDANILLG